MANTKLAKQTTKNAVTEVLRPVSGKDEEGIKATKRVLDSWQDGGAIYIVNYYIPAELSIAGHPSHGQETIPIPSPAAMFYRVAIHLDGSNWIMTERELSNPEVVIFFALLDSWSWFRGSEGKPPRHWEWDQPEHRKEYFLELGREMLAERVRKVHSTFIEAINNADGALRAVESVFDARERGESPGGAVTPKERLDAERARMNVLRGKFKVAVKDMGDAIACAERYDMAEHLDDLFAGLRAAIRAQQEAFNLRASELSGAWGVNVKGTDVEIP